MTLAKSILPKQKENDDELKIKRRQTLNLDILGCM